MAISKIQLTIQVLEGTYAVSRLDSKARIPEWATSGNGFLTISRTFDELSIVSLQELVPENVRSQGDWRCLKIQGPLDFSMTGVLASISSPLAENKVPLFAVSTFDTDYFLLKSRDLERACEALVNVGHQIKRSPSEAN
jgi:hypothetical protein